jgi:hypothetical protein
MRKHEKTSKKKERSRHMREINPACKNRIVPAVGSAVVDFDTIAASTLMRSSALPFFQNLPPPSPTVEVSPTVVETMDLSAPSSAAAAPN